MGVSFRKQRNKWRAYTHDVVTKKQVNLGVYQTRAEALAVFEEYERTHPRPAVPRKPMPQNQGHTCVFCGTPFRSLKKKVYSCRKLECQNAYRRSRYKRNQKYKEWRREYERRPEVLEQKREWYRRNPRKPTPYSPEAYKRNYAARRAAYQRYRLRQASNPGQLTKQDIAIVFRQCKQTCVGCNKHFDFLTVDHKVPVSKGGWNSRDNIQPLCKACNSRKKDKTAFAACRISDRSLFLAEYTPVTLLNNLNPHTSQVELASGD